MSTQERKDTDREDTEMSQGILDLLIFADDDFRSAIRAGNRFAIRQTFEQE